jgi:hypothetical protein
MQRMQSLDLHESTHWRTFGDRSGSFPFTVAESLRVYKTVYVTQVYELRFRDGRASVTDVPTYPRPSASQNDENIEAVRSDRRGAFKRLHQEGEHQLDEFI